MKINSKYLKKRLNEESSPYTSGFEGFVERIDEVSTEDELRELYDEVNAYGFNMSDLHYLTYLIFKKMKSLEESLNEDLFDKPSDIADSICKYLDSKNFYNYELVNYDSYPMDTSMITFEVDGDWKHDHWRFKDLVYDWSFDNNKSIYKMESELVRDDGSDSYASDYFIYVTENEDSLNALKSMSKLFSEDYKEESLREDLGLDPWYGKYVPIDIGGSKGTPRKVYFYFDSTDFDEAEEEFLDIIPEPYVKAKLYGRASEGSLVKDGWKNINESLNEGIKKDFKDKYLNLKRKIEDEASKNNSMVFFSDGEDILPAFRVKSRDKFYSTCMWNALYNMIGTEKGLRRYSDTEFGYEERLSKFRSSLYRDTYKKRAYSGDRVKSNESLNEASYGGNRYSIVLKDASGGLIVYAKGQIDAELTDEEAKEYGEPRGWRNYYNSRSEAVKDYNFIDGICKKYDVSIWEHDSHTWGENDCIEIVGDSKNQVGNALNDLKGLFSFDISESLKEASYGGAFDIEDDQFFTRDDINEFGYDVADQFSAWADNVFELSSVYMDSPTELHLEVSSKEYEEYSADIKIDMRSIRNPKDLYKYEDEVLNQLKDAYLEYHEYDECLDEKLGGATDLKVRLKEASDKKNKVKLRVTFYPYERYASTSKKTATVSGSDLLDALSKMVDRMGLYITSESIKDEDMTAEDVIESIESSNGDGCDYIVSLVNVTTGEVLIEAWDEDDEEDWDN